MVQKNKINRLVILIVSGHQVHDLMPALSRHQLHFTIIDSSGGLFQEPTISLLVGLNQSQMGVLTSLVEQYCKSQTQYVPTQLSVPPHYTSLPMIEARIGGALLYAFEVERFEQI